MTAENVRNWHLQQMAEMRQRVMDRIAVGTKSTSPHTLATRLAEPLKYYNPLPDNSSGSKSRPFFGARDDSGRPTADELVYLRQREEADMRGGAIHNFQVAQQLLNRRRQDFQQLEEVKAGLPPTEPPQSVLTDLESKELELNVLLRNIGDAIESEQLDSLSTSEIKNIPRLLISLSPYFDESRVTEIIGYLESQIQELNAYLDREADDSKQRKIVVRVIASLTDFIEYLKQGVLPYLDRSYEERIMGANKYAKRILELKPNEIKKVLIEIGERDVPVVEPEPVEAEPEGAAAGPEPADIGREQVLRMLRQAQSIKRMKEIYKNHRNLFQDKKAYMIRGDVEGSRARYIEKLKA